MQFLVPNNKECGKPWVHLSTNRNGELPYEVLYYIYPYKQTCVFRHIIPGKISWRVEAAAEIQVNIWTI